MQRISSRDLIEAELAFTDPKDIGNGTLRAKFKLKLPKKPKGDEDDEDKPLQEDRFSPGTKVDVFVPIFFSAHMQEEWYDTEEMLDKLEDIDYGIKDRVREWMRGGRSEYSNYRNQREDDDTFEECPKCGEGPPEDGDYACCAGEECQACGYDPVEESELAPEGDWENAFEKFVEAEFSRGTGRGGSGWQKFIEGYGANNMPLRYIGDYGVDEGEVGMLLEMIQSEWNEMNSPDPDEEGDQVTWPSIIRDHGSEFSEATRRSARECSITDYKEISGTPGVIVTFVFGNKLPDEDLHALRDWCIGQGSDGFGEGFEQRDLRKELDSNMFKISINMFSPNQKSGKQVGVSSHEVNYDTDGGDYPPVQIIDVSEVPSDFHAKVQSLKGKISGIIGKAKAGAKKIGRRVQNAGRALAGKPPVQDEPPQQAPRRGRSRTESLICQQLGS